ncbi:MAG: hypothetical protein Q9160_003748 [Pyrenula sp. 1 TL-2023]
MPPSPSPPRPPPPTLYHPTLILHGGAGSFSRTTLPPSLEARYRASLLTYLRSTHHLLTTTGSNALDAAVHAVSLMEDDELFNCGRGSVFNEAGENVMEASVMVASVRGDVNDLEGQGWRKRGAGVMEVRGTRHPVRLAREVLLGYGEGGGDGEGGMGSMHCQLAGEEVERWGWEHRGLERKEKKWFWTRRRWEEHLRGLGKSLDLKGGEGEGEGEGGGEWDYRGLSQGTVGAVCLDQWGNLAVATSTGGLTNKKRGRIGDTPTLGAGFWAESWDEDGDFDDDDSNSDGEEGGDAKELRDHGNAKFDYDRKRIPTALARARPGRESRSWLDLSLNDLAALASTAIKDCLPISIPVPLLIPTHLPTRTPGLSSTATYTPLPQHQLTHPPKPHISKSPCPRPRQRHRPVRRRAIALSGTGNGDSFLRTAAAHTVSAICRFSPSSPKTHCNPHLRSSSASVSGAKTPLSEAITAVAGPNGTLQRSAGSRFDGTGEGIGGIIGVEVVTHMPQYSSASAHAVAASAHKHKHKHKHTAAGWGHAGGDDEGEGGERRGEKGMGEGMIKGKGTGTVVADFNCGGMWRAWVEEDGKGGERECVRVWRDEDEDENSGDGEKR